MKKMQKGRTRMGAALLLFRKFSSFVADAADVVHADIVELCQQDQAVHWNACLAKLIIAIGSLAYLEQGCNLGLGLIGILPEGTDAFGVCHGNHLKRKNNIEFIALLTFRVINSIMW